MMWVGRGPCIIPGTSQIAVHAAIPQWKKTCCFRTFAVDDLFLVFETMVQWKSLSMDSSHFRQVLGAPCCLRIDMSVSGTLMWKRQAVLKPSYGECLEPLPSDPGSFLVTWKGPKELSFLLYPIIQSAFF